MSANSNNDNDEDHQPNTANEVILIRIATKHLSGQSEGI